MNNVTVTKMPRVETRLKQVARKRLRLFWAGLTLGAITGTIAGMVIMATPTRPPTQGGAW